MENVENQSQESCARVFGNECQRNWGVVAVVKLSLETLALLPVGGLILLCFA